VHPADAALAAAKYQREVSGGSRQAQTSAYLQTIIDAALAGDTRITADSHVGAKENWRRRREGRVRR
jgi:hypothetical protein